MTLKQFWWQQSHCKMKRSENYTDKYVLSLLVFYVVVYFNKNAFYSNGTKATPYATSFSPLHKHVATQNGNEYKREKLRHFCIREGIIFHVVLFVKDLAVQKEVDDGIKGFCHEPNLKGRKWREMKKNGTNTKLSDATRRNTFYEVENIKENMESGKTFCKCSCKSWMLYSGCMTLIITTG